MLVIYRPAKLYSERMRVAHDFRGGGGGGGGGGGRDSSLQLLAHFNFSVLMHMH